MFQALLDELATSIPAQCIILSFHLFLCLVTSFYFCCALQNCLCYARRPCDAAKPPQFPFLDQGHLQWPLASVFFFANILICDMVLVSNVKQYSVAFQRPVSFSLTLLSRSMTHRPRKYTVDTMRDCICYTFRSRGMLLSVLLTSALSGL